MRTRRRRAWPGSEVAAHAHPHARTRPTALTGTCQIQMVLLKNALLLGVALSYGTTLVGVQAPESQSFARGKHAAGWHVWAQGGVSSHDFQHVPLSAADLAAADLAADEAALQLVHDAKYCADEAEASLKWPLLAGLSGG